MLFQACAALVGKQSWGSVPLLLFGKEDRVKVDLLVPITPCKVPATLGVLHDFWLAKPGHTHDHLPYGADPSGSEVNFTVPDTKWEKRGL